MSSTVALLQSRACRASTTTRPNFKVEVEGRELDPQAKGDVLDLKVTMDIDNLTSFDLTINNWDDKHSAFKYSDTQTFDVGNRVHIRWATPTSSVSWPAASSARLTPQFPRFRPAHARRQRASTR